MSIRYKIALLFAVLVTFLLISSGIFVYFFSAKERQNTFRDRLRNRALATAKIYSSITDNNYDVLNKMDAAAVASLYDRSISILNYTDAYDYIFSDTPGDSLILAKKVVEQIKINTEYFFNYKGRTAFAFHKTDNNNNFILAIAASDSDGKKYLAQLQRILIVAGLSGTLLSFITGLLFAKGLIRPIKMITREVNLISTNNLSQRLKVSNARDELTGLVITLNTLLDRMQDSFAIQRRFISNASHELSTPLTSISSQLEVSLQKKRTEDEYRDVIKSVYEDIKDVQLLTRSLLDIAKTGTQGSIDLSEVRIDEVILKVAADVQKLQLNYRVVIDFDNFPEDEGLLTVFGNSNLLYIAFKNIIENGCKYSVNHTTTVIASFSSSQITVTVTSIGDIIAEADIQNVFQPFFRTDTARTKQGFGLGLTLTKRILTLHQSVIEVVSKPDTGTVFTVRLPNKFLPL